MVDVPIAIANVEVVRALINIVRILFIMKEPCNWIAGSFLSSYWGAHVL